MAGTGMAGTGSPALPLHGEFRHRDGTARRRRVEGWRATMHGTALSAEERNAVTTAMQYALELHRKGILDQAEGLYSGVLKLAPDRVEALHFLGVLKNQQGRPEEALALIAAALELNSGWVQLLTSR
jgi:tetratricopeptide (TPR) repeat protein